MNETARVLRKFFGQINFIKIYVNSLFRTPIFYTKRLLMLKKINKDTPISISLQSHDSTPPTNFRYTAVCLLGEVQGVYSKQNPKLKNYFAVGTREGPILIVADTGTELHRVSLLCGHSSAVTCITTTLHEKLFISISSNGQLCGWSMLDGSCIFSCSTGVPEGDLRISLLPLDRNAIFIWNNGGFVYKYNFLKQTRCGRLQFYGIASFVSTEKNNVCVCNDKIITLAVNFEVENVKLIKRKTQKEYIVLDNGIIEKKGKTIYFRSLTYEKLYLIHVEELDDVDSIVFASWNSAKAAVVFLSGKVVTFNLNEEKKYQVRATNELMITNAECSNDTVVGIHSGSTIFAWDENGVRKLKPNHKSQVIHIPYKSKPKFYISEKTENIKYIVKNDVKRSYKLANSVCTSIYSTKLRSLQYVICGAKNGNVSIFNQKTGVLFLQIPAVSSSVIGFAPTPFFVNGSRRILAVGEDGSLCLFNLSDSKLNYLGQHFKVDHIFVNEAHYLIFVQYEDNSVLVFNLETPDPIEVISFVPNNATKIWSNSSTVVKGEQSSLGYTNTSGSEIIFSVYDFSLDYTSLENNESFAKEAEKFINILNCKQSEEEQEKSIVLIGTNRVPTLFYGPFAVTGYNAKCASPFTIVVLEIACLIIARIACIRKKSAAFNYIDCLPYLTQMVFKSQPEIANNASKLILTIIPNAKPNDYIRMISYLIKQDDPTKFEEHEQLMLVIAATANKQLVPVSFLKPLFKILQKLSWENKEVKNVAFSLMTDGIKTWIDGYPAVHYYEFLIKALIDDDASIYTTMVVHCANADFSSFLQAFKSVFIKRLAEGQNCTQMISLIANASLRCGDEGTKGSLLMAKLMSEYNISLFEQHLEMQKSFFDGIDICGDIMAIGTCDGVISVFNKKKFDYDINLFNKGITHVKIIPDFIVVCSVHEMSCAVLSITKKIGIFNSGKAKILERKKIKGEGKELLISLNEEGNVEVEMK